MKSNVTRYPVGNKNHPQPTVLVPPIIKRSINFGANGAIDGP